MLALYMPRLPMGGIEKVTVTLANHWAAEGGQPTVLLDRREGALIGGLSPGVRVATLAAPRTAWAFPRLVSWLRRNRPTVLHSALPHNRLVALAAGALTGTRITIAEHSLLADKIRLDRRMARLVGPMRLLYPRAAAILAASEAVAEDLCAILGLKRATIRVVGNPVVPDDFAPDALERPADMPVDGAPVFLAIGRLAPVKDFATLLRAFRHVVEVRPAHLIILGAGPEHGRLLALAEELGLGDRFRLLGIVPEPFEYLRHATALIVSSLSEGFGNTVVEAMACGTPVVATRCGGPEELLRDGALGRLVPVGDAAALGEAMLAMLEAPAEPALLKRAAAEFSVSAVAGRYLDALMPYGPP